MVAIKSSIQLVAIEIKKAKMSYEGNIVVRRI